MIILIPFKFQVKKHLLVIHLHQKLNTFITKTLLEFGEEDKLQPLKPKQSLKIPPLLKKKLKL